MRPIQVSNTFISDLSCQESGQFSLGDSPWMSVSITQGNEEEMKGSVEKASSVTLRISCG